MDGSGMHMNNAGMQMDGSGMQMDNSMLMDNSGMHQGYGQQEVYLQSAIQGQEQPVRYLQANLRNNNQNQFARSPQAGFNNPNPNFNRASNPAGPTGLRTAPAP